MNENGNEKVITLNEGEIKECLDDIRVQVDANGNMKIDPGELMNALKCVASSKLTKEQKKKARKELIKESFGQGGLMTIAVLVGSGLFYIIMLIIEAVV